MIICAINSCPSDQTTKINGKPILFFPFPDDALRKDQWLHNCNLASGVLSNKEPLRLCELHFEANNFTASMDLKANAIPTLFIRIEEPPKKYKAENILASSGRLPFLKQKKLDEDSQTVVTQSQNLLTQFVDNTEDSASGCKMDVSIDNLIAVSGSVALSSTHGNCEAKTKKYRLTIQIDKIRSKPGPRCKKLVPLITLNTKYLEMTGPDIEEKSLPIEKPILKKRCHNGGCRLKKCIYESKDAFQCELCNKYYTVKRNKNQDNNTCPITIPNSSLQIQTKKPFICDICQLGYNTQIIFDKHVKLHVSTDSSFPYKCHQCAKLFELKEDVKQHCLTEHPKIRLLQITSPNIVPKVPQKGDYNCSSCNITFRNDQVYKNHMNSHKKKEDLRYGVKEANNIFPVSNPLTGGQLGILQPVKFTCNVCLKEFDNVGEVDVHTRTHLEEENIEENHKCNICRKVFKKNSEFSEHLKQHLSRAFPCSICSKAFINRTTLNIHLKTHDES